MGEKAGISLLSYFLSHMSLIPHFWRISALSIVSLPLQYRGCTSFGQKTFVLLNCRLTAGRILINFHSACEILSPLHIYIAHSGVFLLTATSWITFTKSIFLNSKQIYESFSSKIDKKMLCVKLFLKFRCVRKYTLFPIFCSNFI